MRERTEKKSKIRETGGKEAGIENPGKKAEGSHGKRERESWEKTHTREKGKRTPEKAEGSSGKKKENSGKKRKIPAEKKKENSGKKNRHTEE